MAVEVTVFVLVTVSVEVVGTIDVEIEVIVSVIVDGVSVVELLVEDVVGGSEIACGERVPFKRISEETAIETINTMAITPTVATLRVLLIFSRMYSNHI